MPKFNNIRNVTYRKKNLLDNILPCSHYVISVKKYFLIQKSVWGLIMVLEWHVKRDDGGITLKLYLTTVIYQLLCVFVFGSLKPNNFTDCVEKIISDLL